jgi:hypothetical protein
MSSTPTPMEPIQAAIRRHLREIFAGCARESAERPILAAQPAA